MPGRRTQPQHLAGERGAVLVMFAVFASVMILFASFVLDVGNWFEHKRHLQNQADAAAFAASQSFAFPCTEAVKHEIYENAAQYGGVGSVITPEGTFTSALEPYNTQIGNANKGNVVAEINKKTYFGQPSKGQPNETTTVEKAPCEPEASMIDVKMTESELPWFFKAFNVKDINVHARVAVRAETTATKVLPLIESEPVEARVFYVDDTRCLNSGENVPDVRRRHRQQLRKRTARNSQKRTGHGAARTHGLKRRRRNDHLDEQETNRWNSCIGKHQHIGVRFALAGQVGALTGGKVINGKGNESVCARTRTSNASTTTAAWSRRC